MKKPSLIVNHPILPDRKEKIVTFFYNDTPLQAREGEMITSALAAYGIYNIGINHIDGKYQGLFCANGMCSQCRVIADGEIVKGCMTPIKQGMKVYSIKGLPELDKHIIKNYEKIYYLDVDIIIIDKIFLENDRFHILEEYSKQIGVISNQESSPDIINIFLIRIELKTSPMKLIILLLLRVLMIII